jgi:hypothetical protein
MTAVTCPDPGNLNHYNDHNFLTCNILTVTATLYYNSFFPRLVGDAKPTRVLKAVARSAQKQPSKAAPSKEELTKVCITYHIAAAAAALLLLQLLPTFSSFA